MNSGKICISVCAATAAETLEHIRRAAVLADVVEVRFDCVRPEEIEELKLQIAALDTQIALLATFRSPEQGGKGNSTVRERREFWGTLAAEFWAVDLEEDIVADVTATTVKIISHHDFASVPDDLTEICRRLADTPTDIIKIAVNADDITDALPVWKLLEGRERQLVPIAMGEAGKWTRILGPAYGAAMTYAALDADNATAPGQVTAAEMIDVYRVRALDRDTQVYGVIGNPILQSVSPFMHNPAFAAAGLNAVFIPFFVKNISEFMRRMVRKETREVELNFGGFSVTMPHKQAIMPFLDAVDETATAVGAVNTVTIRDGEMTGHNTDVLGFITPLTARIGDVRGARVAVFGAGGAARAVVHGLKQAGADVTIFARDVQKAGELGQRFKVAVQPLKFAKNDFDVLVNATPLGMKGERANETILSAEQISGSRLVYDLVTRATETPLLAEARRAGVDGIGGLEMLIAQGMKQFELWTERDAAGRPNAGVADSKNVVMKVESLNCPNCGAGVASDSSECIFCKSRLKTMACPSCLGLMFVGTQFCGHCGAKAVVVEAVDSGPPGDCPRCKVGLELLKIDTVTLAECRKCSGLWSDAENFQHICATREEQAAVLRFVGAKPSVSDPPKQISYVPCPKCRQLMNRSNFARSSGVIIDSCKQHGVWFDAEELPKIIDFIQKGGIEHARQKERMDIEDQRQQLRDEQRKQSVQAQRFGLYDAGGDTDMSWAQSFIFDLFD